MKKIKLHNDKTTNLSKVSVNLVAPPAGLARCKHRHRRLSQSASEAFTCEAAVKCRKGFLLRSPLQLTEHHREWMKGGYKIWQLHIVLLKNLEITKNSTMSFYYLQVFGRNHFGLPILSPLKIVRSKTLHLAKKGPNVSSFCWVTW